MITEKGAQDAFEALRDSTDQIGQARAELERSEILRKRVRKRHFLAAEGSVAQREAMAEVHEETEAADKRYVDAMAAFETLRAKRDLNTIALDVWRTEAANRRRA